jgi:hypothetical protein
MSQRAAFDVSFGFGDLVWTNNNHHEPRWVAMIWDARFDCASIFKEATNLAQTHCLVLYHEGNSRKQKYGFVKFWCDYTSLTLFAVHLHQRDSHALCTVSDCSHIERFEAATAQATCEQECRRKPQYAERLREAVQAAVVHSMQVSHQLSCTRWCIVCECAAAAR